MNGPGPAVPGFLPPNVVPPAPLPARAVSRVAVRTE
jgi:hypothetical protein